MRTKSVYEIFKEMLATIFGTNNRNDDYTQDSYGVKASMPSPSPSILGGDGVKSTNFTVFSATGGKVVQTSHYDYSKGQHMNNLYVINDNEDFGEELTQILVRESLTR